MKHRKMNKGEPVRIGTDRLIQRANRRRKHWKKNKQDNITKRTNKQLVVFNPDAIHEQKKSREGRDVYDFESVCCVGTHLGMIFFERTRANEQST